MPNQWAVAWEAEGQGGHQRPRLDVRGEPQFVLRAEGVETLECVRPRNKRNDSRVLQPDVIIGWADWNKVQPFAMSGWAIPGQALTVATAPATKWHLRVNLKGSPPVYLNVQLDPMRKRPLSPTWRR